MNIFIGVTDQTEGHIYFYVLPLIERIQFVDFVHEKLQLLPRFCKIYIFKHQ